MRTLLADGDIDAYQIASACQQTTDWGDGEITTSADIEEAKRQIDIRLKMLKKMLGADRVIVCLTDTQNFRKDILPTYKANRQGVLKPVLLTELRQHLKDHHEVFQRPFLEADDVMGILSTMGDNDLIKGERIIVSIDKDMKSVPGLLFNPMKVADGVIEIGIHQADYQHMYQTLIGDATDGYKGCPGVGPKKAFAALKCEKAAWWDVVIAMYEAKGLTEADALVQAQVSRICRSEDYDFVCKKPIPWTPNKKAVAV